MILRNYVRKGKWMQILKMQCDESCFRLGALKTVARELAKNRPYLMGEQEISWDKGGTKLVEERSVVGGGGNVKHQMWTRCFVIWESCKQDSRVF
jgi:hypothetical protein